MQQVNIGEARKRRYPLGIVLVVSCNRNGKANVMPAGWSMDTSIDPPMWAVSVGKTRHTHKLISQTDEFVVVFPSEKHKDDILYTGTHSGRNVDKFANCSLKPIPARKVRPPLIEDSVACLECKVRGKLVTGDHTIFAGEIVAAHVSQEYKHRVYNVGKRVFKVLPNEAL